MLGEGEHVNELQPYEYDELARRLTCDWRRLADHLGLSDDEKRAIEAGAGDVSVVDPGRRDVRPVVQVLRMWRKKRRSTVRILRQTLAELASDELVRHLDELRLMPVKLSLVLKRDGRRQGEVLSMPRCPARKPLIDVIRPMLNRQLGGPSSLDHPRHVVVKLDITGASDDIHWSSEARRFVGQEWTITYTTLQLPAQTSQTAPRLRDLNLFDRAPQRNAMTWIDDEVFRFGYLDTATTTSASVDDDAAFTLASSSSFDSDTRHDDADTPIQYENSGDDDNSSFGTEAVITEPFDSIVLPLHGRNAEQTEVVELRQSGDTESDI